MICCLGVRAGGALRKLASHTKNSAPSSCAIPTGGEVFDDGTVIELVEDLTHPGGLSLLKWNGRKSVVGTGAEHGGKNYVPITLHPSLRRALQLPSTPSPIKSTATLFAELVGILRKFTGLREESCFPLVGFVFASWLADCLPVPINLGLWSPMASEAARVLLLLSCFCRQALPLSGTSARDIGLLPPELQATLLIFRPGADRRTREILSSCGWRGFHTARGGQFGEFVGSVALSTDAPLRDASLEPMIEIAIPPSNRRLPRLDQLARKQLARLFLPKLLHYRLLHYRTVVAAGSAEAVDDGALSQHASWLRTCFSDEPKLQEQLLAFLVDQDGHEPRLADPRVPLIEVLWARCHELGREKLYVAEAAADLNEVSLARGGPKLSCRLVGSVLRSVGVRTFKLDWMGRGIRLDKPTRTLIPSARPHP